jgi:RimJ/RimL family protein N-acetyltransferase
LDETRKLRSGDEEALEAFLQVHAETSMFMRSNLRASGIEFRGELYQGDYYGYFREGIIVGAAGHFWNDVLILQVPVDSAGFLGSLAPHLERPVAWLNGPLDQVERARDLLGLSEAPLRFSSREKLFSVCLEDLVVPAALTRGRVICRPPRPEEISLLVSWRAAYHVQTMGERDSETMRDEARKRLESKLSRGVVWVLERGGTLVSLSDFNAHLDDIVQIGGVWTPPEFRCKGYARSVVAGSLLAAKRRAAERAVLFTENPAAIRAYESIGFRETGRYGLIRFEEPQWIRD